MPGRYVAGVATHMHTCRAGPAHTTTQAPTPECDGWGRAQEAFLLPRAVDRAGASAGQPRGTREG